MKTINFLLALTMFAVFNCIGQSIPIDNFKLPVVIQTDIKDTAEYFCFQELNSNSRNPKLVGHFKFKDSIYFNGTREKRDSLTEEQYLWEVRYFGKDHSLSSDGLQIVADYKTSIVVNEEWPDSGKKKYYYPIYIVNETSKTKVFVGKNSNAFAIQEALDTGYFGRWYPIESTEDIFCGNGTFRRKIEPNEFLMFLVPKYSGSEKTLLRIRSLIGQNIIISNAYEGYINPKQFHINKKSWIHTRLKESKRRDYHWLFYDGIPKDLSKY